MKAFKFACPVCGQHINADAEGTGSQIECPTCYQKLVVPQAPASDDPKFIISAAQVRKVRPNGVPEEPGPALAMQTSKIPWMGIATGLVLVAGATMAFVFHDSLFKSKKAEAPDAPVAEAKAPAPVKTPVPPAPAPAPVMADERWKLDLTEMAFPETPAEGKVHGDDFNGERAYLQNGTLYLRQVKNGTAELSISIALAKMGETMSQNYTVDPTTTGAPKVTLRWKKDDGSTASLSFMQGYGMKLELGFVADGKFPGKIYLCTPDDAKSFVVGTFVAEVKKPKAPKK